jgi:sulfonate transport system permease protein
MGTCVLYPIVRTDTTSTVQRVDRILLAIVLLAVLGKTTDAILGIFERWAIRRWT